MKEKQELNLCFQKLTSAGINGEDIFNLVYPGVTTTSCSATIEKFQNCGLNPWFFRDYFIKSRLSTTKEEQEDLDEQLEYDLIKTKKWKYIK